MNTIIRAGWLTASWLMAVVALTAQTTVQENLMRADKQFDLYAYNLALRTYEQVLKEQPTNSHALSRIGDCYFQLNKPEDALPWYDRAVVLGNASAETMFNYGKALMQTGDYIGAKKWFVLYSERNRDVGQQYALMCDFALQASAKESLYLVLDEPLNTAAADYSPAFYQSKIVYNSARTDIKRQTTSKSSADWTGSAYNQLYVTKRNASDNYLRQPEFLHGDLQHNYNEGPVSFSADGRRVAFCRNNFIDGTRQIAEKGVNMSLYIADVVDGNWANERAFRFNGSDYATGFPSLSADGNTLYFASNQDGGLGGWDIYVSKWDGADWSTPRNLGSPLNTPGDEVTPYFDGSDLYFSSDWHKGLGGLDVFRADIQNDIVGNITHLGTGINSSRDDYGFIYDSKNSIGYLTSTRPEGRGNEDIWQVRKTVDEFEITVTDPQRNPISYAEVDFSSCNAGSKQTDISGRYSFAVAAGKANCRVTVRKAGYSSTVVPIQSNGEKSLTAVLMPEYGTVNPNANTLRQPDNSTTPSTYNYGNNQTPVTYNSTNYPVQNGNLDQYNVFVNDEQGRPVSGAEINLNACGLATVYTDYAGKGSFYFPQGANCNAAVRKIGYEDANFAINSMTNRNTTLLLRTAQRANYIGSVQDASTRYPLQNVLVSARSRQSVHETATMSNIYGKFELALRPYQTYDISYAKQGYLNFASTLQTESTTYGNMELNQVSLIPDQSAIRNNSAPVTYNTGPTSGGMISLADLEDISASNEPMPLTTNPPASNISNSGTVLPPSGTDVPVTAYAIQVSANPSGFTDERIRKYDMLSEYGNLYSVKEGTMYKLRLGVFPTRDAANTVLQNNVTPYVKDAFVLQESQATAGMLVSPSATASTNNTIASKGLNTNTPLGTRYAVQVASWPDDHPVLVSDYANLNSLGHTYIQPEDKRLRVRVGTYSTYEQAKTVQTQAVQLGYKDAIIVQESLEDLRNEKLIQPTGGTSSTGTLNAAPATYSTPSSVAPITSTDGTKYYVRVSAVENPNAFNTQTLSPYGGVVEKWPIGSTNKTAIMLTGFSSVGQAMVATDNLRVNGYRDAYIIQDQNGRMSRYSY